MPKGDPRQAKVVTTWALRGDKIYFDETGQYQFLGKEGACTASVRRTRLLSRALASPSSSEKEAEPGSPEKVADQDRTATPRKPAEAGGTPCTGDEAASRVELTLPSSLLRAGDPLAFETRAFSRNGCPVKASPRIEFVRGRELLEELPDGAFRVRADAPSGDVDLRARVGDVVAESRVAVVSRAEIESLFADSGAPSDAAPQVPASATAAVASAVPQVEPSRLPLLLGLVGGLTACTVAVGWLVLRTRSRRGGVQVPTPEASDAGTAATVLMTPAAPSLHPTAARVCPVCGERFTGTESYCGKDGSRLVREN